MKATLLRADEVWCTFPEQQTAATASV